MNAKPLRCFLPPSSTGCGSREESEERGKELVKMVEVKEEASESEGPWMRLGIGIGATGWTPVNKLEEKLNLVEKKREHDFDDDHCGQSLFTEKQWCELQEHAIIFKYIASGLPVPLGLIVPIWKSVASSVGSVNGGIYRIYPSFVGFSPQGFDNRNMVDPEPLRCRRTDGKKWRCGKNVVTGQKYCEQHVHRGRLRSRKLVEASRSSHSSDTMTPNSSSTTCSVSNSSSLQLVTQKESVSRSAPSTSSCIVETKSKNTTMTADAVTVKKSCGLSMNTNSITNTGPWIKPSTCAVDTNKYSGIDITNHPIDKKQKNFRYPFNSKNVLDRSRVDKNPKNFGNKKSQGLDFSPKSVLPVQGGCYRRSSLCQIDLEVEPWRCKRTDGKKWRCRRDAVANEKYCVMHMHRGAKKSAGTAQPSLLAAGADVSASTSAQSMQTVPKTYSTYSKTNLSISVPASPTRASSPSSDATISDTIIADNER